MDQRMGIPDLTFKLDVIRNPFTARAAALIVIVIATTFARGKLRNERKVD